MEIFKKLSSYSFSRFFPKELKISYQCDTCEPMFEEEQFMKASLEVASSKVYYEENMVLTHSRGLLCMNEGQA